VDGTKSDNAPITKPGGSIADRMALLQNAGLSVSSTKRFLNSNVPTPPMSPDMSRHNRNKSLGLSPPQDNLTNTAPVTPVSSTPSPHAFVSPSSLGPPSPTSSPSSSPQISHFTLSEFSQTFPSIDELDELDVLKHPSSDFHTDESSPSLEVRPFPVLSVDPGVRPSSTPITPVANAFMSRPGSPALTHTVLPKPPGLGISKAPVGPAPPSPDKPELPVTNLVLPKALHGYMNQGYNVLFLDVRNRADYDKEHVKAGAVVCLEPSVLMREK
jgi:ubiquitin carboxyl-terminal hydrolase 8